MRVIPLAVDVFRYPVVPGQYAHTPGSMSRYPQGECQDVLYPLPADALHEDSPC